MCFRVKGMFGGAVRPKTGAPPMLSEELEGDFALYVKHCCLLRVPRTRDMLRADILHFTQFASLNVPKMPEDGSGTFVSFYFLCFLF